MKDDIKEDKTEDKIENISAKRGTLRASIKRYIQRMISTGVYKPGDRIVETRLAKELNVSQAPVREAILELSVIGLLEERPYSGSFVNTLSAADIEDIYNTRAFIEEYAVKRAAKKMTDEQLSKLGQVLEEMSVCTDQEEFVALDTHFHELIMDGAQSPALKRIWTTLRMSEWTYTSTLITRRSLDDLLEAHREIYNSVVKHADHTAGAYMFLHIQSFAKELIEHLTNQENDKAEK